VSIDIYIASITFARNVCVIITDGHPLKSLNKEFAGSTTCTRFLRIKARVSVSFRAVGDVLRMMDT